jgi:hypothetical protein
MRFAVFSVHGLTGPSFASLHQVEEVRQQFGKSGPEGSIGGGSIYSSKTECRDYAS